MTERAYLCTHRETEKKKTSSIIPVKGKKMQSFKAEGVLNTCVSNCTICWDSKVFIGLEDVKTLVTFQRRHHVHVLWPDLMVKEMWDEHYGTINSLLWTLAMQGKQEMVVVTEFSTSRNVFINEKSWTQFPLMTLGLPGDWISMPECMRVITKHFSIGSPSPIPLEKAKQALADSP